MQTITYFCTKEHFTERKEKNKNKAKKNSLIKTKEELILCKTKNRPKK